MIHWELTSHLIILRKYNLASKTKQLDSFKTHNQSKRRVSLFSPSPQDPPTPPPSRPLNMGLSAAKMTLLLFHLPGFSTRIVTQESTDNCQINKREIAKKMAAKQTKEAKWRISCQFQFLLVFLCFSNWLNNVKASSLWKSCWCVCLCRSKKSICAIYPNPSGEFKKLYFNCTFTIRIIGHQTWKTIKHQEFLEVPSHLKECVTLWLWHTLCLLQNKHTPGLGFLSGVYNLASVLITEHIFRPWARKLGYSSSAGCGSGWWVCVAFRGEGDVNTLCCRHKSRMGKDWILGWGGEGRIPVTF